MPRCAGQVNPAGVACSADGTHCQFVIAGITSALVVVLHNAPRYDGGCEVASGVACWWC